MVDTKALQVETVTRGAVPEDAIDLAVLRDRGELGPWRWGLAGRVGRPACGLLDIAAAEAIG